MAVVSIDITNQIEKPAKARATFSPVQPPRAQMFIIIRPKRGHMNINWRSSETPRDDTTSRPSASAFPKPNMLVTPPSNAGTLFCKFPKKHGTKLNTYEPTVATKIRDAHITPKPEFSPFNILLR
jgi:hypothetical protein